MWTGLAISNGHYIRLEHTQGCVAHSRQKPQVQRSSPKSTSPGAVTPTSVVKPLRHTEARGGTHSAIMASPDGKTTHPLPGPASNPSADGLTSPPSSASSSSEAENEGPKKPRIERPRLTGRQKSNTIIVPKGPDVIQTHAEYPPDDARAMSPRRNSADLERLGREARQSLKE